MLIIIVLSTKLGRLMLQIYYKMLTWLKGEEYYKKQKKVIIIIIKIKNANISQMGKNV